MGNPGCPTSHAAKPYHGNNYPAVGSPFAGPRGWICQIFVSMPGDMWVAQVGTFSVNFSYFN
jgi:hypothetical protein